MSQNPYEAPQTIVTPGDVPATNQAVEIGPELTTVAAGAKLCYVAILLIASALVAVFVLGFIVPREIAPLVGLGLLAALLFSAGMHVVGVAKLLHVDSSAKARGLLLISLVTCIVVVAGYGTVLAFAYRGTVVMTSYAQLGIDMLGMIAILTLLGGLWRIGNHLQQPEVTKNAKIALVFFGLLYASSIAVTALLLLPSFQQKVAEWQRMSTGLSSIRPIYFSLVMVATIFYVKALDGIVKVGSKTPPRLQRPLVFTAFQEPDAR